VRRPRSDYRCRLVASAPDTGIAELDANRSANRPVAESGPTDIGAFLRRSGDAESAFVKALAQDSTCAGKCLEYGTLLSNEGRFADAVPLLQRQLAWDNGEVLAARLLALDLMKLGDYVRAIPYLEAVAQREPKESHLVMLGVAYLSAGRRDDAVATFRYMARFDVGNADLERLSKRLEDGATHPEALANLQEFAFYLARGWM
jgi:tetratricopeptide (TPR) repeat protein